MNDFAELYRAQRLCPQLVAEFCAAANLTMACFQDLYSRHLAESYFCGDLDFLICDRAMNELVRLTDYEMTEYAWSVFDAFDQGEYHHRVDSPDIDPEQKYTRPMIEAVLGMTNGTTACGTNTSPLR